MTPVARPAWWKASSFALVTGALFLFALVGQFVFQMVAERNEAAQHGRRSVGASERIEAKVDALLRERGIDPNDP